MLCKRVIDREKLLVMEAEIVETLCLFERFFPPSFFDIMVHFEVVRILQYAVPESD